jgi:RHS repeat-associated protein
VTFTDGSTITYSYAADGTKLRTVHTINGTTTTKDYCSNVVYENGVQKMLLTDEGYVNLSDGKYYYYLKDHQGNNRVVVNSSGTVSETNHYYPFGGVFASTGNVQPYKYNGKELDTKKGLNWYDYGARQYDAALGRWFAVDPLAEKYYNVSPYTFTGNYGFNVREVNGGLFIFVNGFDPLEYGIHLTKYPLFFINFLAGDLTYIPKREFKNSDSYGWGKLMTCIKKNIKTKKMRTLYT